MHNRPMMFVTLAYIAGIILGKYCFVSLRHIIFVICILTSTVFIPLRPSLKRIGFYLGISVLGYLIYKISCNNQASDFNSDSFLFLRNYFRKFLCYNFASGEERNFVTGLLLGERFKISKSVLRAFRYTNTIHVLAISGMHVGFIGLLLVGVLRLLFIKRKVSAMMAILGVLLYVNMVGWQPPATRSAIMFCILLMGWILDRPVDNINSLFLAGLVILLIEPWALFMPGFQLSFVIVLALLITAPVIMRQNNYLIRAFLTSIVAWLSSLPILAYHFKVISPVSILANIVVVPCVNLAITLGFTSILLGQLYLPISGIFNCTNYYLIKAVIWFVFWLVSIPNSYFHIQDFPLYIVFLFYASLGGLFYSYCYKRNVL